MKNEVIHEALNYLSDDMIEAVDCLRKNKKTRKYHWKIWTIIAACLCIAIGIVYYDHLLSINEENGSAGAAADEGTPDQMEMATGEAFSEGTVNDRSESELESVSQEDANNSETQIQESKKKGVWISKMQVDLYEEPGVSKDMVALFIYQGRVYIQDEWIYDHPELVGDYVGTATGLIDEWSVKDDYVELAGSISGDFYTVNGYDPSFMLCMKEEGAVTTYINDNGIFLVQGSDLYEERLHLPGNYHTVLCQDNEAYWNSEMPKQISAENMQVIEELVRQMNEAKFQYAERSSLCTEEKNLYRLTFQMDDGTEVHIKVGKNGYVFYNNMDEVYVQIDMELYNQLLDIFAS